MPKENQTHIIEKQLVEIITDKYENAQHLQNDVSRLCRYTLTPALEKICDKYNSTKDIIRIDRMELDIGRIPLLEFDKFFCENSVEQFQNKLEDIIAEIYHLGKPSTKQEGIGQIEIEKEGVENQYLSETDKQFEILVQFLKTGNLPWHQVNKSNTDISELFMSLYEKQPEQLSVILRTLFKNKIVLKRFNYQFPEKVKQNTLELFLSHSQGIEIAGFASILIDYQHLYQHLGQSKKDLQNAIWDLILSRAIQQDVNLEKIIVSQICKFLQILNEANSSPVSFIKDFLDFQVYFKKAVLKKQDKVLVESQKIIDQTTTLILHKITGEKNSNTRTDLLKSLKTPGGIKHLKKLKFKNELDKKTLTEILEQIELHEFDYQNKEDKENKEFTAKYKKDPEIKEKIHLKNERGEELRTFEDKDTKNKDLTESTEYNKDESSRYKKKKIIYKNTENQYSESEKENLILKKTKKVDVNNSDETNAKKPKSTSYNELQKEQNSQHKNGKATIGLKESEVHDKAHQKKGKNDKLIKTGEKDSNNEDVTGSTRYSKVELPPDNKKKGVSKKNKYLKIEKEEDELTQKKASAQKTLDEINHHDINKTNIKEAKNNLPGDFLQEQNKERIENERLSFLGENGDTENSKSKTYKKDTSETLPVDNNEENEPGKLNTYNSTKKILDSREETKELKSVPSKLRASREEELIKQYLIFKQEDEIIIENAGLVIIWPYLPSLFKELDLLNDKRQFKDEQSRYLAVAITQYLASGSEAVQEYDLIFNKLLCGIDLEEPIPVIEELPGHIKQSCQELLQVVVKKWSALKGTSVPGLQLTFLQREGILAKAANGWKVQIERVTLDILLDRLPWSISIIALPWRKELIYVEW